MTSTRLAVVDLVPTPYQEPLCRSLSQTPGWKVRFFYLQSKDSVRGWSKLHCPYDAVKLPCLTPESLYPVPLVGVVNWGLLGHLREFSPDCLLIHGYSYWPQMQAMCWAIRARKPYLLFADSNSLRLRSGPAASGKAFCLNYFCRHAAGVLTIGSSNEAFWRHYGVETERQFRAPLAVDNDFFSSQSAVWRRRKAAARKALGLPAGRLLLYVGRLARPKNLDALIHAMAACRREGVQDLSLAIVGDGPERGRIGRLIQKLELRSVFQFGYRPQAELPKFYGIADAFVLPSIDEPWGLVVNEAMASGLPVLLSKNIGCWPDLLEENGNGFSFSVDDGGSLVECLQRFSRIGEEELARLGARSAQLIRAWNYENALHGILRALESAMSMAADRGSARLPAASAV